MEEKNVKVKLSDYKLRYGLWRLVTAIIFAIGIFVSLILGRFDVERGLSKERINVLSELSTIRAHLEGTVTSTFNLTQGMVHFISHQGDISLDLFNAMSKHAIEENRHIRNIALAPNNQVRWVYPYKGNEKAIGLKYLENAQQRETVLEAEKLGKPKLAGPVNLVQGGLGFINRSPILTSNGTNSIKKYWGLASIVAHVNTILDDGGITSSKTLKIALRGKDGRGDKGAMIWGDSTIFINNPILVDVNVPGGKWQLAAIPIMGWSERTMMKSRFFLIGLINTLIISIFLIILINRNVFIKKKNEDLAQEIAERKRIEVELIKSKEAAESANRMKTTFLANMSHEIRTPMNSILGFSDLLLSKEQDKETTKSFLATINASTRQLLNVINDIIDISIIESGHLKISNKQTKLNSLLNNVYQLYYFTAQQKGLEIILTKGLADKDANILIDDYRITQVLNNLVNNAVKFTEKGIVEFGYSIPNNTIEFFVKDTGKGIPKEYHDLIFERFRQVDEQNKHAYGGNGLGLAISKSLVEKMGGRIWLDSIPEVGSQFYFTIPFKPILSESIIDTIANGNYSTIDLHDKTILVAEDDSSSYLLIEGVLKPSKAKLISVKNGVEALEAISSNPNIDMVLLDIKMPYMDGIQTTKEIRKLNFKIPIVAQTAYAMSEDKDIAIAAGCNYYLSKPIDQHQLYEIIHKVFKK